MSEEEETVSMELGEAIASFVMEFWRRKGSKLCPGVDVSILQEANDWQIRLDSKNDFATGFILASIGLLEIVEEHCDFLQEFYSSNVDSIPR